MKGVRNDSWQDGFVLLEIELLSFKFVLPHNLMNLFLPDYGYPGE